MTTVLTECYRTSIGSLNQFRCPTWHNAFTNTIPASSHLLVFPREAVQITHAGGTPVIANVNLVMLYNHGQEYLRHKISEYGDRCDFFRFETHTVVEAIRPFDESVIDRAEQPFQFSHGLITNELFLRQRRLLERVEGGEYTDDALRWNVDALEILSATVAEVYQQRGYQAKSLGAAARQRRKQLAHDTQFLVSQSFAQKLSLEQMANVLDTSPYHLCRVFRDQVGISIHQYLMRFRLRVALENLGRGQEDLTRMALDLGFSSHSHFSAAFRQAFGLTPSQFRRYSR